MKKPGNSPQTVGVGRQCPQTENTENTEKITEIIKIIERLVDFIQDAAEKRFFNRQERPGRSTGSGGSQLDHAGCVDCVIRFQLSERKR